MTNDLLPEIAIDLQSFRELRQEGCLYIDKTALVHKLVHQRVKYLYLSRPKRFGKSVLIDTLAAYFEGRRDLFEGLDIAGLESEWLTYEVVRFDFGSCTTAQDVDDMFDEVLTTSEERLGLPPGSGSRYPARFRRLLRRIVERSGRGAVILVDEYDYALQHTWRQRDEHQAVCDLMAQMFDQLKSQSERLRFVFLTGIARFAHVSLFSSLNNLVDISLEADYQALCGITEAELHGPLLRPHVRRFAKMRHETIKQTYDNLRQRYDGYHFFYDEKGPKPADVYNPFTLLRSLHAGDYLSEWSRGGASTLVSTFGKNIGHDLRVYMGCRVLCSLLEAASPDSEGPQVILYLAGYLTIKGRENGSYILDYPNLEVREVLGNLVMPGLLQRSATLWQLRQGDLRAALIAHEREEAWQLLVAIVADNVYSCVDLKAMLVEERYCYLVRQMLLTIGLYVEPERRVEGGRTDLAVWAGRYIYVMEFKRQCYGGAAEALKQIDERHYLAAWQGFGKTVIGWAIGCHDEGKGLLELREQGLAFRDRGCVTKD